MSDHLDYRHHPTLRLRYMIDDYDALLRQARASDPQKESTQINDQPRGRSYAEESALKHTG